MSSQQNLPNLITNDYAITQDAIAGNLVIVRRSTGAIIQKLVNLSGLMEAALVFATSTAPTATQAGIGVDSSGNLILNAPNGKSVKLEVAGTAQLSITTSAITPGADNTQTLGSAALRFATTHATAFNVEHAASDANPSAQLGDKQLGFGPGGASGLDTFAAEGSTGEIQFSTTVNSQLSQISIMGTSGTPPATGSLTSVFLLNGVAAAGSNYEQLKILGVAGTSFTFQIIQGGTGSYRPMVFQNGGLEAFRITTTPVLQIPLTSALQIGTTALTVGSLGSLICPLKASAGAPTDANGGNVDGAIVVSSGDTKIYARVGGLWKGVAIA